jgi:predicted nucleotidyltransferase
MIDKQALEFTLNKLPKGYKLLYLTHYGSKLYGTNSENSDTDLKGVFLPSLIDVLLGQAKDDFSTSTGNNYSNNSVDDVDVTFYSFNKFIQLLSKGETGALDMLFSMFREDTILFCDEKFGELKTNKELFITKNSNSFLGYVLNQTRIYGMKGARYNILTNFYNSLELDNIDNKDKTNCMELFNIVRQQYLESDHVFFAEVIDPTDNHVKNYLSVLGKMYEDRAPLYKFKEGLTKQLEQYGARAKKASGGTDFKALSHAVRVVSELKELLTNNFITFPLPNAEYVKQVKYHTTDEQVGIVLDSLEDEVSKVEELVKLSTLPNKADKQVVDKLKLDLLMHWYLLYGPLYQLWDKLKRLFR